MCSCLLTRSRSHSPIVRYQLTAQSWGRGLGCGKWIPTWLFFTVWASVLQGQVSGTNTNHPQCDLRQLGNAQEDTKNPYAARALPCKHWKLHLAACTLLPTDSFSPRVIMLKQFRKKRLTACLVHLKEWFPSAQPSCSVSIQWFVAGDERKWWRGSLHTSVSKMPITSSQSPTQHLQMSRFVRPTLANTFTSHQY